MVLGGNEFISVWTRDSAMSSHSYSQHLFYAKDLPKNVFAHGLLETPVEQVIQCEVSRDGRSIICLEQNNLTNKRQIKIWFNPAKIEIQVKKKNFSAETLKVNRLEKLDCVVIPQNRSKVRYFKQIQYNLSNFEQNQVIPIGFLAFTSDSKAQLWVEDL